ncbi:MAG TPA: HAMP domain-containing histidine kinase [Polyangiaceae bacterium]|nr:HAMP domain-containing histidine kinase [Polyangiaceae bacterium]
MRYPPFAAEMGLKANRPKLWLGIRTGYGVAAAFGALALLGQGLGILPEGWTFLGLVLIKLLTNTLSMWALRADRFVLESAGLNMVADVLVMTGAIYFTGGQASPLFAIYVIEISVIALLSNRGTTIVVFVLMLVAFSVMAVGIHLGLLTQHPSPVDVGALTTRHVALHILFAALVLTLPTLYTSNILSSLRAKEEALEARTRELMRAGEQKSQFMANITHELRTPLHGISALVELLDEEVYGPMNDKQREACDRIARSAEGLERMVDELLLLAKAEAGKLEYQPSLIDVEEVTDNVVSSLRWMTELKALTLAVNVSPGLPKLTTDRGKLLQILLNLVANAIKFTPEGGEVALTVHGTDDAVVFEVRDTGIGIPDEALPHIFDEFSQVDGSDERSHGGIGLGLALVKRLTALLSAEVEAASTYGQGSTFTLRVPVAHPNPRAV